MDTYTVVKNRLLELLGERNMSIHKLAMESAVPPSTIKNILYGKSVNPGIVTIKMLCDGLGVSLIEFFDTQLPRLGARDPIKKPPMKQCFIGDFTYISRSFCVRSCPSSAA